MTKADKLQKALDEIGEEQGFEVGKPLTGKEFVDLLTALRETNDKDGWGVTSKTFHDFYQKKNRKDKEAKV